MVLRPVARMQTEISEASRLVETASREPLGISFTRLTISIPRPGTSRKHGEHVSERLARPFHAGRHDAGSDYGSFQQAQIIVRKIEDFGQRGDFGGGFQIDARRGAKPARRSRGTRPLRAAWARPRRAR